MLFILQHHQILINYYALKVAEAGKPCCIEKPLAPNYQDCLAIAEAFEAKNIPVFVAYYRRTLPRFEQIKKWIDSKTIGDVRHIRWHLSKPTTDQDRSGEYNWRTDIKVATGGYFDDLASHGLDLFIHYFGDIKEVSGISLNQQGLYTSKDACAANWLHESGITGSGSWNFGTFEREDIVEIYGSEGKITFSVFENVPLILKTAEGESTHEHISSRKYSVASCRTNARSFIRKLQTSFQRIYSGTYQLGNGSDYWKLDSTLKNLHTNRYLQNLYRIYQSN